MRKIPKVKLLCQTYIFAIFKVFPELISIEIIPIYSPGNIQRVPGYWHFSTKLYIIGLFNFWNPIDGKYFLSIGVFFICFDCSCFVLSRASFHFFSRCLLFSVNYSQTLCIYFSFRCWLFVLIWVEIFFPISFLSFDF